jgi:hypothetical protein
MPYPVAAVRNKIPQNVAANPVIGSPSFAYQNTPRTNDLGADGYSWSNSLPITVDQYGKIISVCQFNGSGTSGHNFIYSNDNGTTWNDAAFSSGFLARGSVVYDSINDLLHVLWVAGAVSDGVIYRRYSITRDGSNNITAIAAVAGINLQLDFENAGSMAYNHPLAIFCDDIGANGALLCVWSARNALGVANKNEIRASMRVLSNTVADNVAGNWVAPVAADLTSINQSPQVAYSALVVNNNGGVCYPSIGRKASGINALDVYLAYANGGAVWQWRWLRLRWNAGASDWSTGLTADTLITAGQRAGVDAGYALKYQLGTYLHLDSVNDRILFGLATWKDNVDGDTWGYVGINADDSLTALVDAYSTGGAHSFAPTGDIYYDPIGQRVIVSWLTTTTEYAQVRLYNGLLTAGAIVTAYDAVSPGGVDIPLLYPRLNGNVLMMFRDRVDQGGANLYRGLFGSLVWS